MREGFELLIDPPMPRRSIKFMNAMQEAAPSGTDFVAGYRGRRRVLMMYGPGSLRRLPIIHKHLAAGGRVAMWDLGYWNRETAMRLSFDRLHPTAEMLAAVPDISRREFELREDASPDGHIVLVGLGPKSVAAYSLEPMGWERRALKDILKRFPGREIIWRPKGKQRTPLPHTRMVADCPIADVLKGASMVVCRHSNVAIDACVAGIPVECEDGAAQALYQGNPSPTAAQRIDFLRRLSWFEWDRPEAAEAWRFVDRMTK